MEPLEKEGGPKQSQKNDYRNIPYNGFFTNNGESSPSPSYSGSMPGRRNMMFGALWILAGTGITWYLVTQAVQGQSFVLPVIVIIFGLVQLCKGIGQFFSHPDEW
jgi:hypothetical protein